MSESSDPTAYQRTQELLFEAYLDVVVRIRRLRAEPPAADNTARLLQLLGERKALLRIRQAEGDCHAAEYRARVQQLDAEYLAAKAERPEGWKVEVDLPKAVLAASRMQNRIEAMDDITTSMNRKRSTP